MPDKTLLDDLAHSVTQARSLEELARPLLEMLETVTGMESAYLTTVDLNKGEQHVLYARNTADDFAVPEGLTVPWADTLCKRALDEGKPFNNDVAADWGDSEAAKTLGIQTYVSTPVRVGDAGEVYGTLCAASPQRHMMDPHAERALALFGKLIGQYVERERLVDQLMRANQFLARAALTDTLTGLPNRRALLDQLGRLLSQGRRQQVAVLVAYADLDGFKAINDNHSHEIGDAFLIQIAQRLRESLRGGDMAARLGGDEFVVAGLGPALDGKLAEAIQAFERRVSQATVGRYMLEPGLELDYPGASVGAMAVRTGVLDPGEALRDADALMYEVKRRRKALAAPLLQPPVQIPK